ncbi:hypothetical protein [Acinetobacter sp. ANC 5378]|uniref:hypothetical protein n=1 Tax=Acinetobacter sp. ANC 5378 TaxID=2731249 RepID=UPI0014901A0C|nr:hypothetical protein [Acinetobacter sp. ANC 5378]NNG82047.1 hypothetical protein [Acinetobacter sp. ANC 5378]
MIIVYEHDGVVVVSTILLGEVNIDNYITLAEIPREPIESWYIEDGEIKIDQQKLIEFNRQNMPTLSPIQFDQKLDQSGLYDAVQDLIKTDRQLSIAYNRAIFFSRTDPFIEQARIALSLTDEQVDEMWTS